MRLVFAGTPQVAIPSLERLVASDHDVVAVVTRPDAARGRSKRLVPSPVGAWAEDHGIEVLKPETPKDPAFLDRLRALAPDACPVVAYGALLGQDALDIPEHGWINLHFSLLPRWRGAAPAQRTIINGDEVAGASTFRIVRALDAGPVFGSLIHPLDGTETAGELLDALAIEGAELLADTIDGLGTTDPFEQDADGMTLAPKLTVDEAHLDWHRDAASLDRLIRGCSPEPAAWSTLGDERIKILDCRVASADGLVPGELRPEKRRLLVGTGSGALELLRVQPQGKKEMSGADWGRGLHGDRVLGDA